MVSSNFDETIEFLSIKVPDGPLTSRLQHIAVGDEVLIGRKPTGTLVQSSLMPGKRLYLVGTGTGLAPFMSIIKDPDVYERFDTVILMHGVREVAELAYRYVITSELPRDEFLGEMVASKLRYYPTVTREPFERQGRVTTLLETGQVSRDLGLPGLSPDHDRVMICGSPAMLADTVALMERLGFQEGSNARPGQYVIEKAFVER